MKPVLLQCRALTLGYGSLGKTFASVGQDKQGFIGVSPLGVVNLEQVEPVSRQNDGVI